MNLTESTQTNTISAQSAGATGKAVSYRYVVGADGGGTGTRVVLTDAAGKELARGVAGPSGLAHGRDKAWQKILLALNDAFTRAGLEQPPLSEIVIGCGLAGVNNLFWEKEFVALNPGFADLVVETDAYTTLLGAHGGAPGVVIALGTGSVGEVLLASGERREVGGWGFPVGDEASGAWLGFHAVNYAQRVLDGRLAGDDFSDELLAQIGQTKEDMFRWLAEANQTRYATLAPIVIRHAGGNDVAHKLMQQAGQDVAQMAQALDLEEALPLALSGGLAAMIQPYIPEPWQQRIQAPQGDSAQGAMLLIQQHLNSK